MQLGYTIAYVPDVAASLAFFERAFGLQRRFLHESGSYGELDTGSTTLAFAAHELGDMNFPGGHVHADPLLAAQQRPDADGRRPRPGDHLEARIRQAQTRGVSRQPEDRDMAETWHPEA